MKQTQSAGTRGLRRGDFSSLTEPWKKFFATDTAVRRFRVRPIQNKSAGNRSAGLKELKSANRGNRWRRRGERERERKNNATVRSSTKWRIVLDLSLRAKYLYVPAGVLDWRGSNSRSARLRLGEKRKEDYTVDAPEDGSGSGWVFVFSRRALITIIYNM